MTTLKQQISNAAQQAAPAGKSKRFDFNDVYAAFKEPFPSEALTAVPRAGMTMTSVKAQYVVERLNEVCGLDGWRHEGKYVDTDSGIIFEGMLLLDNGEKAIAQYGVGYGEKRKNLGDAYKSAKTDSLSKCASLFGLANDVFKGLVSPPKKAYTPKPKAASSDF